MSFNIILEKLIQEMYTFEGILNQITIRHLAYAENIIFLGENLDMIERLGNKLINTVKKWI